MSLKQTELKQTETSIVKVPKEVPETTIKWTEGDMFWARVTGHPWWPCMVFKDPNQALFTRMIRGYGRSFDCFFMIAPRELQIGRRFGLLMPTGVCISNCCEIAKLCQVNNLNLWFSSINNFTNFTVLLSLKFVAILQN